MLRNKTFEKFVLIGSITIVVASFVINEISAQSSGHFYPNLPPRNRSRVGVCTLEVPTLDLLTNSDRHAGIRPKDNGTKSGFSRIEVCCSGYTRVPHNHYECKPICENDCENGNCTAPNVCLCKAGYVLKNGRCNPTCPIGCANGVCTTYGDCSCNYGFEPSADRKSCTPKCTIGCGEGGECVGADQCKCHEGYVLNLKTKKCDFHCEGGCPGGTCVAPNRCACPSGFSATISNGCEADCPRGCLNGRCTAPGVCTCQPGWTLEMGGTQCKPHCQESCINGDCVAPNTCACKKGYVTDPKRQSNWCVAHCPSGCENGSCASPNFCICNVGFVKESRSSQRCIRRMKRRSVSDIHYELIPEEMFMHH